MVEAIRYTTGGKVLANTLHSTSGAFTDEEIASHKVDYASAFGIAVDAIEVERLDWDGEKPYYLAFPDPVDAAARLPAEPAPAPEPTADEKIAELERIVAKLAPADVAASPMLGMKD